MDGYIDAPIALLPDRMRRTERIKLYGPDAFEGMRRAGAFTGFCLDGVADLIKPKRL
jgi:methionyl aminopeptidase